MKRKHKRLTFVGIALLLLAAAAALILTAFEENIVFFFSPTDILAQKPTPDRRLRLGGLVEEGSVTKPKGGVITFRVTDTAQTVPVSYKGILPDCSVKAKGSLQKVDISKTFLWPMKYWLNTMKITCRRKSQKPLKNLGNGKAKKR